MTYRMTRTDTQQLYRELTSYLQDVVDQAVEDTRPHIHVDTGRLKKSLRAGKVRRVGNDLEVRVIMGGLRLYGVVREEDIQKDVDYSLEEETRHPQMRRFFIPAISRRLRR